MWTRLWAGAIDWQPIVMALLPTLLAAWLVASAARRLTRAALKSPLPQLRQRLEDHRRHRRSAGNHQDPQPSGPADPRPAALPSSSSRSIPNDLNKAKPLANASPRRGSL
jgi:hypothetical protein